MRPARVVALGVRKKDYVPGVGKAEHVPKDIIQIDMHKGEHIIYIYIIYNNFENVYLDVSGYICDICDFRCEICQHFIYILIVV